MKSFPSLVVALLIAAVLPSPVAAQADDPDHVYVLPYHIPEDDTGNRILYLDAEQHLVLGARWGACTYGLVRAWTQTAEVYYEIEGSPLLQDGQRSKDYWGKPIHWFAGANTYCVSQPGEFDEYWTAYWQYDIGPLSQGTHQFFFRYSMPHPFHAGESYDSIPGVDNAAGWIMEVPFTVVVE